ncbi:beta-lactamase class C [Janthinobacterium sp. CG_23.3]|uniref:class C beta-lactamase n=1 Tax=unclassified Janthinobacterium TaxID=2610881 RepID=UPI002DFCB981|nr:beta-lactamase class C [Janthinobacterium sp. CG_S6]
MPPKTMRLLTLLSSCLLAAASHAADNMDPSEIQDTVDSVIKPLLKKSAIPGMAVALTVNGKNYFYNYGVASKETGQAVSNATLFEIGSVSKTFTATLAAYAQVHGLFSLSDSVSQHLPYLRGSSFDNISLLHLGTHTAGNFPLQIPDEVSNTEQLMEYYKNWKPAHAAGTNRTYSNPGIGLLGIVTAKSMGMSFADAMEKRLFPELGMTHSYVNVPAAQMQHYAQGYNKEDAPVRVNPGLLALESYGVKTSAADLIRYIDANMGLVKLDGKLQRAITDTHTGYFKSADMTQDLMWEQYPGTVDLSRLLAGNSYKIIYDTTSVSKLTPPLPPQTDVLINKTGSTAGFAAYALYHPAKKIGIVMLANRNYPIDQRVTAAYQILTRLGSVPRPPKALKEGNLASVNTQF